MRWGGALAGGSLGWFADSEGGLCGLQQSLDRPADGTSPDLSHERLAHDPVFIQQQRDRVLVDF